MKIYISADIEGVSGLVAWSQCGRPNSDHYDYAFARERLTADVNAAIRGARIGGAKTIVVKDSHGNSKNLLASQLEPGVELISGDGSGRDGMMEGIDASFDAAFLIGYHAMAGTLHGVMEHTISGQVHRMWINGVPAGEIGMSSGIAGAYGVPVVCISSDAAGCREAGSLIPGVATAVVKTGFGRYMAQCIHPLEAEQVIQASAEQGVRHCSDIPPTRWDEPTTIKLEFNRSEEADSANKLLEANRIDAFTVEATADSYLKAHTIARNLISMASLGANSNK